MSSRAALAGVAVAVVSMAVAGVSSAAAHAPREPLVRCGDVIGQQASGSLDGSRVVLGLVSVPPVRIQRAAPSGTTAWKGFSKWGMLIHSGVGAQVSVPRVWRGRVAITWGANTGIVSALRFAPCRLPGSRARPWNAYPGGFYINTGAACVPLTVTARHRSTMVWFGIGTSCSS